MIGLVCVALAATAVICAALLPPVRRLAVAWNVIDVPSGRKAHAQPVPLLGGVAICLSMLLVGVIGAVVLGQHDVIVILVAAAVMAVVGLIDDRRGLTAAAKVVGQLAPVAVLPACDLRLELLENRWADAAVTIVFILGVTNAFNLIDNMDGLAAGSAAIAAGAFALIGVITGAADVALLAAVIAGACAGFLPCNFPRARMFMGDAGALTLGFAVGVLPILTSGTLSTAATDGAILVLALPMSDTLLVIVSRLRRGVNPFTTPGTDHISHRLARRLGGRTQAVLTCWSLGGLAAVAGTWMVLG